MRRPQHRTTRTARPTGSATATGRDRGASDAQQAVAVLLIVALGAVAAAVVQHL